MLKWLGGIAIGMLLGAGVVLLVRDAPSHPEPGASGRTPAGSPQVVLSNPPIETVTPEPPSTLADIYRLTSRFEQSVALYNLLRSADLDLINALLDEAAALQTRGKRHTAKLTIYARMVELDPHAAVRRVTSDNDDEWLLRQVIVMWAMTDAGRAIHAADALQEPVRTSSAKDILGIEGLSREFREAIAERFSLHEDLRDMRTLEAAKADPPGAWYAALSMDDETRKDSLYLIASEWARLDPLAAMEAVAAILDERLRENLGGTIAREWMRRDPDAALDWALALPPASHRGFIERVLRTLARTDPQATFEALRQLDDPVLDERLFWTAASAWASSDPYAAFDWAISQSKFKHLRSFIDQVMEKIASTSPEDALALASRIDDALQRNNAFWIALGSWARSDVRAAARWIDASKQPIGDAAGAIIRAYAELDPHEALDWLLSQDASLHRHAPGLIQSVAETSPEDAKRMVEGIPAGDRQRATEGLVYGWLQADPPAAIREIPRLNLEATDEMYSSAFRNWSETDSQAAIAFLDQVPAASRDPAVRGIFNHALYEAQDTALAERMYDRLASH